LQCSPIKIIAKTSVFDALNNGVDNLPHIVCLIVSAHHLRSSRRKSPRAFLFALELF